MKLFHALMFAAATALAPEAMSQSRGCTDPRALNYQASATENDGSCLYPKTAYQQHTVCPKLSDTLSESSALLYWNNWFWTINDSGNPPCLYALDSSSGRVLHKTSIAGVQNYDWEELAQDSDYLYIGDFGNNRGSRKDLKILKIRKSDLRLQVPEDTVAAEIIRFSMADQQNFSNTGQNHDYDMEAFCSIGDSLHLFSKNWVDYKTRHYVCPKDTGYYALYPAETLDVGGQVTGAAHHADGICVLTGYTKNFQGSFIYLCWDYRNQRFLSGNRRRIEVGNLLVPGQNEGICFKDKLLYMSNEKQVSEAALHRLYTTQWTDRSLGLPGNSLHADGAIRLTWTGTQITIEATPQMIGKSFQLFDTTGHCVLTLNMRQSAETIELGHLAAAVYLAYADRHFLRKIVFR